MSILTISTPMLLNVTVNCYLVETASGYFLIDSGRAKNRHIIEQELIKVGCKPGNLRLILLTHGDFDHCGNAAYLRQKYETKIAMHRDDLGMVRDGNMYWNRNKPNVVVRSLMRLMISLGEEDRFDPDYFLEDNEELTELGFGARSLQIPGHSKGSVGFWAEEGDLFCGDLLANRGDPDLWSIIDDMPAALESVDKLLELDIQTVYPGHGDPFPMQVFKDNFLKRRS